MANFKVLDWFLDHPIFTVETKTGVVFDVSAKDLYYLKGVEILDELTGERTTLNIVYFANSQQKSLNIRAIYFD